MTFNKNCAKYIIFDMDGVLINSEPVTMKAATLALAEIGIAADRRDFEPYIGAGEEKFITEPCRAHGKESLAPSALKRLYELFDSLVYDELFVYPSVHRLLDELKSRGIHMAIASSSAREKLIASLDAAKIQQTLFDTIITGSDVSQKKPSPEIYLTAMKKLGAEPGECIVIEDALSGIASAKAAGCICFAVTTSFTAEKLKAAGADFTGDDIAEILGVLDNTNI